MEEFTKALHKLCTRHKVVLSGTMRVTPMTDKIEAFDYSYAEQVPAYGGADTFGPFIVPQITYKPEPKAEFKTSKGFQITRDSEGYDCPVTGKWIEGRAAHRENLKRHGCHVLEKGEHQDNERNRIEAEEKTIDSLAESVVRDAMSAF